MVDVWMKKADQYHNGVLMLVYIQKTYNHSTINGTFL